MNWKLFYHHFISAALAIRYSLILLLAAISILLAGYLLLANPSYKTSWMVLLPGTDRSTTINLDNLGESRSSGGNAYGSVSISPKNTYREIALSDAVIKQAAKKYGVEATAFSKPRITLIDQTPAMRFTLKGESPEELVYRAKLYNDTFHQTLDDLRQNEIERNFLGVESNLAEAKIRLTQARGKIVEYQTTSNVVTDEQFKRWLNDSEQLRTDQTNTEIELSQLQATIESTLEQLSISKQQAKALLLIQSNPLVHALLKKLGMRLAAQVSNNSLFAPQNPLRKQLDAEVTALISKLHSNLVEHPSLSEINSNQIYSLLSQGAMPAMQRINKLLADYGGLQAKAAALAVSRQNYRERIRNHTEAAATLADLQRDHQIAEAIFSSALAKLDTSRLDIYATYPLTQLLTQPGATLKRDRLQSKLMIIAAFLVYGLLSLAMILRRVRALLMQPDLKESIGNCTSQPAAA